MCAFVCVCACVSAETAAAAAAAAAATAATAATAVATVAADIVAIDSVAAAAAAGAAASIVHVCARKMCLGPARLHSPTFLVVAVKSPIPSLSNPAPRCLPH